MAEPLKVTARVRLTVDVPITQGWSPNETMATIEKQAKADALQQLQGQYTDAQRRSWPIVDALVTVILVEKEKSPNG